MSETGMSVGVATCGRPAALERCLRALVGQTSPAGEVIVVDQAPSETARAVLAASGLRDTRYVEQPRLGLSASRNMSLDLARRPVLAVTDDDCVPDPDWIGSASAALKRSPRPEAVTGPILPVGEMPPGGFAISLRQCPAEVDHAGRVPPWEVGSGANFAAPVALLRRCGGWDERLGTGSGGQAAEDADLLYRLLLDGATVRFDPTVVVRHEWQTRTRRLATRWSYGFGIGTMCGLWLTRRDLYAFVMLGSYARMHARPLLGGLRHRDWRRAAEHCRGLASLAPGLVYGIRVGREPSRAAATEAG